MENRKYLKKLNKVRIVAQTIEQENFKRQYENIITPILEKYQKNICSDDEMSTKIKRAIEQIQHLAKNCQYYGNKTSPDFSEHEKLYTVELICNKMLNNYHDFK